MNADVVIYPRRGTWIGDAACQARDAARRLNMPVILAFNETLVTVEPQDEAAAIADRWLAERAGKPAAAPAAGP